MKNFLLWFALFKPIGVIRSEHTIPGETPIQPTFAEECRGRVELFEEYAPGLQDIERGVFATRAACRPNPVGISIVELLSREGRILRVKGLDVLDGTPLLDIKPYTARFDRRENVRSGWQDTPDDETSRQLGKSGYRS